MKKVLFALSASILAFACDPNDNTPPPSGNGVLVDPASSVEGGVEGFYLLGEGNMGANNASLDWFDYASGRYYRNIFTSRNPSELGLGDQANDIVIYGTKLYIALTGSNMVKVLDASTARQIAEIEMPSPRYIAATGPNIYVSSYAGNVARIDTVALAKTAQCAVGREPEDLVVVDDELYVALSGWSEGYGGGSFETSLAVVDVDSFTKSRNVEVAANLSTITDNGDGTLTVLAQTTTYPGTNKNYILNTTTDAVVSSADEVYSLPTFYHPSTGEKFELDAGDYTIGGTLRSYSSSGAQRWAITTGVIPRQIEFLKN